MFASARPAREKVAPLPDENQNWRYENFKKSMEVPLYVYDVCWKLSERQNVHVSSVLFFSSNSPLTVFGILLTQGVKYKF